MNNIKTKINLILIIIFIVILSQLAFAEINCGLRGYDGNKVVAFACEADTLSSGLKIIRSEQEYKIVLISPSTRGATRFNIQTDNGIKALKEYVPEYCGNNFINDEEECDGTNLNGQTCELLGYDEGTLSCYDNCLFNTSGCNSNIYGCTNPNAYNYDSEATEDDGSCEWCGDTIVQSVYGEECDGSDLNEQTCESLDYHSGTLSCYSTCEFDTSGCNDAPECDDGRDNNRDGNIDLNDPGCSNSADDSESYYIDFNNPIFTFGPHNLAFSYDDCINVYNSLPVRVQPETSQPHGYPAGGSYIVYHKQASNNYQPLLYYAYYDGSSITNDVSLSVETESFPSVAIDPVTADPFVVWNTDSDVFASYDLFHMLGSHSMWKTPFEVFEDYMMPYTFVGSSPLGEDYKRVYVYADNTDGYYHTHALMRSSNILLAYADFTTADLDAQSSLDWNTNTISMMNEWYNNGNIGFYKAMIVKDNIVAFMGYKAGKVYHDNNEIFVCYNTNFGEDEFTCESQSMEIDVENIEGQYGDEVFECDDLYFAITNSGGMNVVFGNDNNLHMIGAMSLRCRDWSIDAILSHNNRPLYFVKHFVYDFSEGDFHFTNLYPKGSNLDEDEIYLPWDDNNNGELEYDGNDQPIMEYGLPFWYHSGFHYLNNFKIISSENENYLIALWQDGLYNYLAQHGYGYSSWVEVPRIAISVSFNNGLTWTEPIFLDSENTYQLADMIPVYSYPGDKFYLDTSNTDVTIEKFKLLFYDDNDFCPRECTISGGGCLYNGGTWEFAELTFEGTIISD